MTTKNYQIGGRPKRTERETEWIPREEYDEDEHGEVLSGTPDKYQIQVGTKVVQKEEIRVATFPVAGKYGKNTYFLEVDRDEDGNATKATVTRVVKQRRDNAPNNGEEKKPRVTDKVREIVKEELNEDTVVTAK